MITTTARRFGSVFGAAVLGLGLALVHAAPSQAGPFDGDITNQLPSNYTVKIATMSGPNLPERCHVPNDRDYNCRTYWLPSGRADDQLNGANWDTDGFMVQQPYVLVQWDGAQRTNRPAGTWSRFGNLESVTCRLLGGTPTCEVE